MLTMLPTLPWIAAASAAVCVCYIAATIMVGRRKSNRSGLRWHGAAQATRKFNPSSQNPSTIIHAPYALRARRSGRLPQQLHRKPHQLHRLHPNSHTALRTTTTAADTDTPATPPPPAADHDPTAIPAPLTFPTIADSDFQHPRDKAATTLLKQLVPLEMALRQMLVPLLEEGSYLDNIGRGVQASEQQYPTLHNMIQDASTTLGMEAPDLFVRQDPRPNAYTMAIQGKRPFVVLHTSLIDLLTPQEVYAVIGHELGHLKCEHGVWITILNLISIGAEIVERIVPLGLVQLLTLQLTQWRRSAELSCDRAALLVSQNPDAVMGTLMKLSGGSRTYADEMSPSEFAKQAQQYDTTSQSSWLGRIIRQNDQMQLYPLPILRANEVVEWSQSDEYKSLISRLGSSRTSPPPLSGSPVPAVD